MITAQQTFSMNCELAKAINHPNLSQNSDFWEKLYKIEPKDGDAAIKKLIYEYAPEALGSSHAITNRGVAAAKVTIDIAHKAEKEIGKLSKANIGHYDEFLKTINENGSHGFRSNPGKWHYEKLPSYGSDAHSVRLDGGMRVLFDVEKDGSIMVRAVNNTIGH